MKKFKKVYDFRDIKYDAEYAKYKDNDASVVGSAKWFKNVESGAIETITLEGTISKVYMTGHNDFAQFDMHTEAGDFTWVRNGDINEYVEGREIKLTYVLVRNPRPRSYIGKYWKIILDVYIEI